MRKASYIFALVFLMQMMMTITVFAVGNGNIDSGGSNMEQGTLTNKWTPGNDGARVTVVSTADGNPVTTPIDFSNKKLPIAVHFGLVSKLHYRSGQTLTASTEPYVSYKPAQTMPPIVNSASKPTTIERVKAYFCSEYMVMTIAQQTGIPYESLLSGEYKILLEPLVYVTFEGIQVAFTATEAAYYNLIVGGKVKEYLPNVSHKNLPLAMFLQTPDLGYPAWTGARDMAVESEVIISSLGLGIVTFDAVPPPEEPEVETIDYEYRVNTDVITAVRVRGGQSDPDHEVTVRFRILNRTYRVDGVYYPSGDEQLVWIRWKTPDTPQNVTIQVSVSGGGRTEKNTLTAKIIDLDGNDPPNPIADDRNDTFSLKSLPRKPEQTSAEWGVWRPWWQEHWVYYSGDDDDDGEWVDEGWWEFDYDEYQASLSASMRITTDDKSPTATTTTIKSGYGVQQRVTARVTTNQSSAVTDAQNAVTYFPEFDYATYWRLLERTTTGRNSVFDFRANRFSTFNRRTHFTPIWYPDGNYMPYTWVLDCWTPKGMLSMNLSDQVQIRGNLWDDWHIAPLKP